MRKTIIIISVCIVTLLLGYTGYRGYQVWKQNHWLTLAKNFAAKADYRNEMLSLQQVLRANPRNVEANRMQAEVATLLNSPVALLLRQRVVELDPKSVPDRMALVETALKYRNYDVATNTLAGLDEAAKRTADYHNLAAVVANALGRPAEAELHFSEAVRLEPTNIKWQLNLATVRLHSTNSLDAAEARINLKRISLNTTNAVWHAMAQHALIADAMRMKDLNTALMLSKELVQATNVPFGDRLIRLDVLREAKTPDYAATLTQCKNLAATDPVKLSEMNQWLTQRASLAESLAWLRSLPLQVQTNAPANAFIAQGYLQTRDWHGLQGALQNQNWNESEFVRNAWMAKSLREQGLTAASMAEWSSALQAGDDRKKSPAAQKNILSYLYFFAAQWAWNSEAEQILWIMVNRYPEEKRLSAILTQILMAGGRTRPLMQLFELCYQRQPDDLEAQNNLAYIALLLGETDPKYYRLAQAPYASSPQNASYASTYALSLYVQKKYPEALAVMQKLTAKQLQEPSIAGYYSIILKASGDSQKAREYFKLTAAAPLLPEEKKLFERALAN
jgi:predicted Zn-dependent protease